MDSEKRDKTVINCDISNVQGKDDKISYFIFESVQARNERTIRRMWITTIILIILLFVTNAIWLWAFSGFDMETYDYEQGDNGINIIGDENKEVTYNGAKGEDKEINEAVGQPGQNNTSESQNTET